MKFTLCFFFYLLTTVYSFAQQPSHFFIGKDEFEGIQIYDVIQDDKLNYWFASDHGFYKYDGYTFREIECKGLKGLSAFGFVKNKNGLIFCYNLNNQILKIENDHCSIFYELKEGERSPDLFIHITEDNYLAVICKDLILFNENGQRQNSEKLKPNYHGFPFILNNGKSISHMIERDSMTVIEGKNVKVHPLKVDPNETDGLLIFFRIKVKEYAVDLTNKNYFSFDEKDYSLKLLKEHPYHNVKEFYRFYNENDQLWVAGTVSGVQIIADPESANTSDIMFSNYLISDVFHDHEGNILLSTFNNGIIVIPNLIIPDILPNSEEHSIVSIFHDIELGWLMGTLKGQLLLFDGKQYKILSNEGSRPLQSIFGWPDFPYVLFDDGAVKAYNKKSGKISLIYEGSLKDAAIIDETSVYLALNTSACKLKITGKDDFTKEFVQSLNIRTYSVGVEQKSQHLYIATSDGLKIISPEGKTKTARFENETVFANDIGIYQGKVYVATKTKGILIYEKGTILRRLNLPIRKKESEIYKIKIAGDRIYLNTSNGLIIMDLKGKLITQLNKVHGFSNKKIFDFDIKDQEIWIAHSKGIQTLNLYHLTNEIQKPLIRISSVHVNNSRLKELASKMEFEPDQRKFLFTFSSPTLRNKDNISYHYKLVGYDSEWQIVQYNDNSIIYNALESGTYTFLVKAENQGVFSETKAFSFVILTPFYAQWWFIVALILIFLATVIVLYKRQLKIQQKKAQYINELTSSKLTAIQSQMNPHFIFNSLNSIQDLVLKGDIDNSYVFITKFSNLVRRTLNYSDKEFIDFEQEIKLIELYLSLEKLRFKENLEYSIETNGIEDIILPPMLIQPFIENALIHGLLHKEGTKILRIRFSLEECLICEIEDNGIGRAKSKEIKERQGSFHDSFSGNAIKKRFEILDRHFGGSLGFNYLDLIERNEPSGTKVILKIPFKRKF
jgi:sensor histidine kinase YesM